VASGLAGSLCVSENQEVYAWGLNSHSQCALPKSKAAIVFEPILIPVFLGLKVKAVACGAAHCLAIVTQPEGIVYAWGMNNNGQCGIVDERG